MRNIAAALLLLFCACNTGKHYIPVNSSEDISRNLAPQEQQFTIDASEDNIIKGVKGTRLFIPAGALVFEDGSAVKGDVAIALKEYYSSGDMLSANLSSMSDSFILQTGGMLYVDAIAGGKKLRIDGKKSMVITFPKKKGVDSMQVFYGSVTQNGTINWRPGVEQQVKYESMDTLLQKDSTLYTERMQACGYIYDAGNGPVDWILKHPDSTIWLYVEKHLQLPNDVKQEFKRAGISSDDMDLTINKKGRVTKVEFYQGNSFERKPPLLSARARGFIAGFLKGLPEFDMSRMTNEYETYFLQLCYVKQIDREKYAAAFKAKYDRYSDQAVKAMDVNEAELYILNATQLGWINCDRFYEYTGEKTDFIVAVPDVKEPKVQLIFPEINSVMQGSVKDGKAVFANVPVGMRASITAIAFGGKEQPLMAKADATISKQPFALPGFAPFTMKELDAALNGR